MPDARRSSRNSSARVAFCGMMAALSVVLMLTAGAIPMMTYVAPLACGLLLLPVRLSYGRGAAWTTWLTCAVLVLLLGVDREGAFFYVFVGWYPIFKWEIEKRVKRRLPQLLLKAALFAVCVAALYALLAFVLHMDAITSEFAGMGLWLTLAFYAGMIICLMLYDQLITPLTMVYVQRIEPKMKFIRH